MCCLLKSIAVLLILSVHITSVLCNDNKSKWCAPHCTCRGGTVKCSKLFKYIPKLPNKTRKVILVLSNLPIITGKLLDNIPKSVQELVFIQTETTGVSDDAFEHFNLSSLMISQNEKLKSENISLLSLRNGNIKQIQLTKNALTFIGKDFFKPLEGSNISSLSLSGNKLEEFNFNAIQNISVEQVTLSSNKLQKVIYNSTYLPGLKYVNLENNKISEFPTFCAHFNVSSVPDMENLNLINNSIHGNIDPSWFCCMLRVKKLSLGGNRVLSLTQNFTFQHLQNLQSLSLFNTLISKNSFAIKSLVIPKLTRLQFQNNNFDFRFLLSSQYEEMFNGVPNLINLDLSANKLPSESGKLQILLRPLRNLVILQLQSAFLKTLPEGVFQGMPKLRRLVLQGNYFYGWPNGEKVFGNKSALKELYLSDNNINLFNKTSVPLNILNNLSVLSLAGNPFSCVCSQAWLAEWLRQTKVKLVAYPVRYVCKSPPNMRKTYINDYNPSRFECLSQEIIITIATSITFLCIVAMVSTLYLCRWNLRYFFFQMTSGYQPLHGNDKEQKCYVSYADEDREFVHNILLLNIPNLYIRLRDFTLAEDIMDNIEQSIESCKKVIIILSNNYFQSNWQVAEMRYIHAFSIKYQAKFCIVILLQDFDRKFLSAISRNLLNESPTLEWTKNKKGQKVFWGRLRQEIAKPTKKIMSKDL